MSRISVIVPVYNVKNYLRECVQSILNQTIENIDVILVDDGSNDGSQEICDEIGKEYTNVTVIHKSNGGLSSARNTGLKAAKGDYISFIDSDDYIKNNTYETLLSLNRDDTYDIIAMARILVYENGVERIVNSLNSPVTYRGEEFLRAILQDKNVDMSVCDKIFRREIIENLRFPEGYLSEDILFLKELIPHVNNVLLTGVPCYYYRQRNMSITKSFNPAYKKTYIELSGLENLIRNEYPSCISDFEVFKVTFLCHIFLLCQTYKNSDDDIKHFLSREFDSRFISIIRGRMIPKRIKIQSIFLRMRIGGIYSWLKRKVQNFASFR